MLNDTDQRRRTWKTDAVINIAPVIHSPSRWEQKTVTRRDRSRETARDTAALTQKRGRLHAGDQNHWDVIYIQLYIRVRLTLWITSMMSVNEHQISVSNGRLRAESWCLSVCSVAWWFQDKLLSAQFPWELWEKNKLNTKKDVLWKLDSTDLWSWFYLAYDDYDLAKTAARHAGGSLDWPPASCGWRRAQFCCSDETR